MCSPWVSFYEFYKAVSYTCIKWHGTPFQAIEKKQTAFLQIALHSGLIFLETWKNMQTKREMLIRGVCFLPEMCLFTPIACKTHLIFACVDGTFGDKIFQSENTIRQMKPSWQSTTAWSIFVSVFYKIKLSIWPFSMVYFCLGRVLDDISASLRVLNQFYWTCSLRVLQDRWIFRSEYKCAGGSNRRCSQLDTQGYPADEWNFNVFA